MTENNCHHLHINGSYKNVTNSFIMTFFICQEYVNRDSFYKNKCHLFNIDDSYKNVMNSYIMTFFPVKDQPIMTVL